MGCGVSRDLRPHSNSNNKTLKRSTTRSTKSIHANSPSHPASISLPPAVRAGNESPEDPARQVDQSSEQNFPPHLLATKTTRGTVSVETETEVEIPWAFNEKLCEMNMPTSPSASLSCEEEEEEEEDGVGAKVPALLLAKDPRPSICPPPFLHTPFGSDDDETEEQLTTPSAISASSSSEAATDEEQNQASQTLIPSLHLHTDGLYSGAGNQLECHEDIISLDDKFSVDDIVSSIAMKEALILQANRDLAKEFQDLEKEEVEKLSLSHRSSLDSDHINSLLSWNNRDQISASNSPPAYLKDILDQFEDHDGDNSKHWKLGLMEDSNIENPECVDIDNYSLDQESSRSNGKEQGLETPSHILIQETSIEGIATRT